MTATEAGRASFPLLLSPFQLGPLTLRNRVVWLPHLTHFATPTSLPSDQHAHYYAERARGGVALIISGVEGTNPQSYVPGKINAYDPGAIPGYRGVTDMVHAHGAYMFGQISDDGNQNSGMEGSSWHYAHAPSAVPDHLIQVAPKAMEPEDMRASVEGLCRAAEAHREGGFDGVEIKVGHDGLLRQFLSPYFNHRDDEYGGSIENRLRFVREAVAAVRARVGDDYVVGVRLSLDEGVDGGYGVDEGVEFARAIGSWGLIDYLNADLGTLGNLALMNPDMTTEPCFAEEPIERARAASGLPTIGFGRVKEPTNAERLLERGAADLVGMARALIADPLWVAKVEAGDDLDVRYCIGCNQLCLGRAFRTLPISCVVNPAAGRERSRPARERDRAARPLEVAVVGGGPAGMKAAEILARRGHSVDLVERSHRLGGAVNTTELLGLRREILDATAWIEAQLDRLDVRVHRGFEVSAEGLASVSDEGVAIVAAAVGRPAVPGSTVELDVDRLVMATGAVPVAPPLDSDPPAYSVLGALSRLDDLGDHVAVWDEELTQTPASVAETIAATGRAVTIVTPADHAATAVAVPNMEVQVRRLSALGVRTIAHSRVSRRAGRDVEVTNVFTGEPSELHDVDDLVCAVGWEADDALYRNVVSGAEDRAAPIHLIGDSLAPRDVGWAIWAGEELGRTL